MLVHKLDPHSRPDTVPDTGPPNGAGPPDGPVKPSVGMPASEHLGIASSRYVSLRYVSFFVSELYIFYSRACSVWLVPALGIFALFPCAQARGIRETTVVLWCDPNLFRGLTATF